MLNFDKPNIMGVVNVTPDSFYAQSRVQKKDFILKQISKMVNAGASIIDIGAESTRPGADFVSIQEEISRLECIIPIFKKEFDCVLSLDTMKSEVAEFGLSCGVDIINDVSALTFDSNMIKVLEKYNAAVILMHMKGTPKTMQQHTHYDSVVEEVFSFLDKQIKVCEAHNLTSIFIDPGIGFGKDLNSNLLLLKHLDDFLHLNRPIVIGTSRKSFIDKISSSEVENRLGGTIASNLLAYHNGASIFRVHDVVELKQAFDVYNAIEVAI